MHLYASCIPDKLLPTLRGVLGTRALLLRSRLPPVPVPSCPDTPLHTASSHTPATPLHTPLPQDVPQHQWSTLFGRLIEDYHRVSAVALSKENRIFGKGPGYRGSGGGDTLTRTPTRRVRMP